MDDLRNITLDTYRSIEQLYLRLGTVLSIRNWDFRREPGESVPVGSFARRSLNEARKAQGVIGIFGDQLPLPVVTRQELEEFYDRKKNGEDVEIQVFMKRPVSAQHHDWIREIKNRYGFEVLYSPYENPVEYQRVAYAAILLMLLPVLPPNPGAGYQEAH